MDEQVWIEAGLLDPDLPTAADRRALLTWLVERGVTVEQMVESNGRGRLFGLAGDLHARPTRPTLTLAQVAERIGMPLPVLREVWRGAGFAAGADDEPVLSEAEAETFGVLSLGSAFFGEAAMLRLASTVGTAVRRIAEATITAGIDQRTDMLLDRSTSELATAQVYEASMAMLPEFFELLATLFRLHHEAGNRHVELGLLLGDAPGQTVRLAVGFADLSGYTPLVRSLTRAQLAELVHRFGGWASGIVTTEGARVIQQLGDAVMFVGGPEPVCAAAVRLAQGPRDDVLPPLRAGVAFGDVVLDGGDYFGPVVNLAARLTTDAAPEQVLVDTTLADLLDPTIWDTEERRAHELKGIEGTTVACVLQRRSPV
jgi:class 3 adenylate cyclase